MRKKENGLARNYFSRPLNSREQAWPRVVLGLVFLVFSWHMYTNPQSPPFSGRWRWLSNLMHAYLGLHAMAAGVAVFGILMMAWGIYHTDFLRAKFSQK